MSSRDQRMPFDEGSFLDVRDPELMAMVAEDIHRGWCAKAAVSKTRSERIMAAAAKVDYSFKEGWNEEPFFLEIDRVSYAYWAQREGRDCWADPQFRRQYARDNPHCVRRNATGRTLITAGLDTGRRAA